MRHRIGVSAIVLWALVTQAACSNGVVDSVSTGPAPTVPATTATAVSPTSAVGVVGSAVDDLPSVVVRDANGNPLSKIAVTFSETQGGGVVTGGITTTNDVGIARPASWRLGNTAGLNVVRANVGSLPPVLFTVTAVPGPPNFIIKIAGDNQIGAAWHPVAETPTVRVIDTYGNGVAGVVIVFSAGIGGGDVTGNRAISDSLGNAAPIGWTLGAAGNQTLIAATDTTSSVTSATFAAVALASVPPCSQISGLADRVTVHSELDGQSCTTSDGRFFKVFPVMLTDAKLNAHQFTLTSPDFDTEIELRDLDMNLVASNNDGKNAGTNSSITVLVPAGVYMVVATSHKPGASGGFYVNYKKVSFDITGCDDAYVMRGIVSRQMATPLDCRRGTNYEDRYRIYLRSGEKVSVDVDDETYSDPGLELTDIAGNVVASGKRGENYLHQTLAFVAPADGLYVIWVWGEDTNTTFTITIR